MVLFWLLLVVLLVLVVVAVEAVKFLWTIMVGWLVDSLLEKILVLFAQQKVNGCARAISILAD